MNAPHLQYHTVDSVSFPEVTRDESVNDFRVAAKAVQIPTELVDKIAADLTEKFDKGQAEHGGHLCLRDGVGEIYKEFLDLWHYASAAISNLEHGASLGAPVRAEIRELAEIRLDIIRLLSKALKLAGVAK